MFKSDDQLRQDVIDALEFEPSVEASQIGVTAKDGVVTLSGTVGTYLQKFNAERAAERVAGVRAIAERIKVELPSEHRRTDADIAQAAVKSLSWDVSIPPNHVQAKVENGYVTLTGEVRWHYQRESAEDAIRRLPGVMGVINLVTLVPQVSPMDVKCRIERAYERWAEQEAQRIQVEARDGEVTLRGRAASWDERHRAATAAWSVPGVKQVENLIEVG